MAYLGYLVCAADVASFSLHLLYRRRRNPDDVRVFLLLIRYIASVRALDDVSYRIQWHALDVRGV